MNFTFSEEQEMLRSSARDFLAKEAPMTYVRKMMDDERGYTDDVWRKMAGLGWMGLVLPEEFGDADVDRDERVRRATARYMEVTETAIRKDPAAWLWLHNRWKTSPPETVRGRL